MGILLMVLGVLGCFIVDEAVELCASVVILLFGMWLYGAFDQILGG